MRKFITLALSTFALFAFVGQVFAATMTVKIEAPKSPTGLNNLNINFVVLDYASDGSITAKCYVSKDGGAFAQFGSDIAITTGGGSSNCTTNSSVMSSDGTYKFYVSATNSSETVSSSEVTVIYNTSGPGTPTNYGKSKVNVCDYKISFKTADDGGKTVKVEVYRSPNTSFTADAGTRVDTVTIGSNTEGSSTTTAPNCSQDFYFVIRAFDSAGNGSGTVGDSVVVVTNSTTITAASGASGAGGAIPAGTAGNVLGVAQGPTDGATGASGGVLGEEATDSSAPTQETYTPPTAQLFTGRNLALGAGAAALIAFLVWLAKKKKSA